MLAHLSSPLQSNMSLLKVRFRVIEASNLLAADSNGTSDPYCEIKIGKETFKTDHKDSTLNPRWDQEFVFGEKKKIKGSVPAMEFVCYDRDAMPFSTDDKLGKLDLDLNTLPVNVQVDAWYPFAMASGMSDVSGRVHLSIFVENPDQPTPEPAAAPAADAAAAGAGESKADPAAAAGGAAAAAGAAPADGEFHDPNELTVHVIEARDLIGLDSGNTSDPYTKVSCDGTTHKTNTVKKNTSPTWEPQEMKFNVCDGSQTVNFVVMDCETFRDDKLGVCSVALDTLASGELIDQWIDLTSGESKDDGKGRGAIHVTMQWTFNPAAKIKKRSATIFEVLKGESGQDNNLALDTGAPPETKAEDGTDGGGVETKEERDARLEEEKKQHDALSDIVIKKGDYQIQVHIIEVRDLKPEDMGGTSDPVVFVEAFGEKQHTKIMKKQCSCVFDELFFFNPKNMEQDILEANVIKISVFDSNTVTRNELIGSYTFDVLSVYYKPNHELYRQWVAIADDDNADDKGIQGYLRTSVTVLGPGDKQYIHDPNDAAKKDAAEGKAKGGLASLVLMPPRIKQAVNFLVVTVHRAENLPRLDTGIRSGIDAYVKVSFAGNPLIRTQIVELRGQGALSPNFNQSLWLPVMVPTMTNAITIQVMDRDDIKDEVAGTVHLLFNKIPHGHGIGPRWFNLYGAPLSDDSGDVAAKMNLYPKHGTHSRGRLLLSVRIDEDADNKEVEHVHKKRTRPLMQAAFPPTQKYTLRALVVTGSDIPDLKSHQVMKLGQNAPMSIKVCIGPHTLCTAAQPNTNGIIKWEEELKGEFDLPEDPKQMPDVFVYMCREEVDVCYCRIPAAKLVAEDFAAPMEWVHLLEDEAVDVLADEEYAGSILMKLAFGPSSSANANASWAEAVGNMHAANHYQMRVHLYQGRGLPAADDDGSLDPLMHIRFNGQMKKLPKLLKTKDPMWYTTVTFDVTLPDKAYMPDVVMEVWDWDRWDANDYVGTARATADDIFIQEDLSAPLPDPKWYPIFHKQSDGGEGSGDGQLLASFQLVPKSSADLQLPPPPSIVPEMQEAYIEVIALGCRDLAAYKFLPMQNPFMEFDIGGGAKAVNVSATRPSKKPSTSNPNFLERIIIPAQLPVNPLFAPYLNIRVKDSRLGGFIKPAVATASVKLQDKLPWSPTYVPPRSTAIGGGNPHNFKRDVSTAPGSVRTLEQADNRSQLRSASSKVAERSSKVLKPQFSNIAEEGGSAAAAAGAGAGETKGETKNETKGDGDGDGDGDGTGDVDETKGPSADEATAAAAAGDTGAGVFGAVAVAAALNKGGGTKDSVAVDIAGGGDGDVEGSSEFDTSESYGEIGEDLPDYLKDREVGGPLEDVFQTSPFETYSLFRGQRFQSGLVTSCSYKAVGVFKGMIRVMRRKDEPSLFDLSQLLNPQPFMVRLYVLNGYNFQSMDSGGSSDPFLKIHLGKNKVDDVKHYCPNTLQPKFHSCYELKATLPGASQLTVEAWDWDLIGSNDFIGATTIDLEDRWFEDRWQNLGLADRTDTRYQLKPLERRSLYIPTALTPQGVLEMWVDIMTSEEAKKYPVLDVSLPPPVLFELRVIVWKTKDVVAMDTLTDQNDLYVKAWMEGGEEQHTDTHWRCKGGKGSFNWRMKFPLSLPVPLDFDKLHVQMWDRDLTAPNDEIAEATYPLGAYFKKAVRKGEAVMITKTKRKKKQKRAAAAASASAASKQGSGKASTDYQRLDDDGSTAAYGTFGDESKQGLNSASAAAAGGGDGGAAAPAAAATGSKGDANAGSPPTASATAGGSSSAAAVAPKKTKAEKASDADDFVADIKNKAGLGPDPVDSQWFPMTKKNFETGEYEQRGSVLMTMELVPIALAKGIKANGLGRSEPNMFPILPEPTGRLKLTSMWNPFYVLNACLGPALFKKIFTCCVCALVIAALVFGAPLISAFQTLTSALPAPIGTVVTVTVPSIIVLSCIFCYCWTVHHGN